MVQGSIIQTALQLIKEKEKQGDKASERIHDGLKTQMELNASQGSWTGEQRPSQVVKEKETRVEKEKDDDKDAKETIIPETSAASSSDDDDDKSDAASASIFEIAQGVK